MSSITPAPLAALRRFTRAEFDRLVALGFFHEDERVELVHGILVRMTPPGPPHRSVVDRLTEMLVPRLLDRARVCIQQPFVAHDESEPEPDVSVVPMGDYSVDHPDIAFLVIEVADSSLRYDRETKAPLYAASKVAEYWIVNLSERVVEVHSDPAAGRYARVVRATPDDTLRVTAFPDIEIQVSALLP